MATKRVERAISKGNEVKKDNGIRVHIPLDSLNPSDKEIIIGINDKYAKVVRGEDTVVSQPVFEQLRNAGLV